MQLQNIFILNEVVFHAADLFLFIFMIIKKLK